MDDDWQEAALSNRHLHNRVGKHGRSKGGKSNGAFDVQKALATYEVKCPAATKLMKSEQASKAKLEICCVNGHGNALLAELILPGVLHATVLMTGSRKTMNSVIRGLEGETEGEEQGAVGVADVESHDEGEDGSSHQPEDTSARDKEGEDSSAREDEEESEEEDDSERYRIETFEKNSFRSPKFWIRWQGQILCPTQEPVSGNVVTDSGYLIFSNNNCGKFQGTISCQPLGWDNVKIQGWKMRGWPARDMSVTWSKT